jgi:hypothetical protein
MAEKRELDHIESYEDKTAVRYIVTMLNNMSEALGLMRGVQEVITGIKGHEISPDGKLGGKGYVMNVRKLKDLVSETVNNLSDLTDTLSDELTNPRWGLGDEDLIQLIQNKDRLTEEFEQKAEQDIQDADLGTSSKPTGLDDLEHSEDSSNLDPLQEEVPENYVDPVKQKLASSIIRNFVRIGTKGEIHHAK